MKILVFSDSHKHTRDMLDAIRKEKEEGEVSLVIHLGDNLRDAEEIEKAFPLMAVSSVPGNCDFGSFGEIAEKYFEVGDAKTGIFYCHGHSAAVKSGLDVITYRARAKGARIALYGHTHVAKKVEKDGLLIMNPGSISEPRTTDPPSYGRLIIEGEKIFSEIIYI